MNATDPDLTDKAIAAVVENGKSILAERIESLEMEMADKQTQIAALRVELLADAEKKAALTARLRAKLED